MMPETHSLYSEGLDEDKGFSVYLPADYHNPNYEPRHYPVIYVLDGEHYGGLLSTVSQSMAQSGNMPEAIVVAVHAGENRLRDYTPGVSHTDWRGEPSDEFEQSGGGDAFLAFVEQALLPHIDDHYRSLNHRTLMGFSLGGLIGLHSFMTQPALFQAYLIIDASLWWDEQQLVTRLAEMVDGESPSATMLTGRLYCSMADHEAEGPNQHRAMIEGNQSYMHHLKQLATARDCNHLSVTVETFTDETHNSVLVPSVCHGLRALFEGHRFRYGWTKDIEAVVAHFSRYSAELGVDYIAPEKQLSVLAWYAGKIMGESARLVFMQYHCERYPKSPTAWAQLGAAYETQSDHEQARVCYNKALSFNRHNIQARNGLQSVAALQNTKKQNG